VRNPAAVRPWQHVLEPLSGYLALGAELREALASRRAARLAELSGPFNFGPAAEDQRTVSDVVAEVLRRWPGKWRKAPKSGDPMEASVLRLDSRKAHRILGWWPRWQFKRAVEETMAWYKGASSPSKALQITLRQLAEYTAN
jgi:CDP-glucose 4,6-dehydratase